MSIIFGLIIFSIIVLFHEFGHYLLARKNGIMVEEFAIGLGPTLIGKKIGDTLFSIKLLPLGGCCVMKGEEKEVDEEDSYSSKSCFQRFQVVFAGPFFNLILAFICSIILVGFQGADLPVVHSIEKEAHQSVLKEGDRILSVDGEKILLFRDLPIYNYFHPNKKEVKMKILRDGEERIVLYQRVKEGNSYYFGLRGKPQKGNLLFDIKYAFIEVEYQVRMVFKSLYYLFTGKVSVSSMSGPVGIVKMAGQEYNQSSKVGISAVVLSMLRFIVLLSANLGIMNLLPIPALDGGRILFIFIEKIRGKKVKNEETWIGVSMAILLGLMVFVTVGDLIR